MNTQIKKKNWKINLTEAVKLTWVIHFLVEKINQLVKEREGDKISVWLLRKLRRSVFVSAIICKIQCYFLCRSGPSV